MEVQGCSAEESQPLSGAALGTQLAVAQQGCLRFGVQHHWGA